MVLSLKQKILIVSQQLITAADLHLQLSKLNFDVIGINNCSEDALASVIAYDTDIVLIDMGLKGIVDGIALAKIIKKNYSIPVFFLNPGVNRKVMNDAVQSEPAGFIHIPYHVNDIRRQIVQAKKQKMLLHLH